MRNILKFFNNKILMVLAVVVCSCANAGDLAQTRFGKVSTEFSQEKGNISVRLGDKVLWQEADYYSATLFGVKSVQDKDYVIAGLGVMGNCCPWLHVIVVEVTAQGGTVHDTGEDIYAESKPEISIQDKGVEIILNNIVEPKDNNNIKFIVSDGKLNGPISLKKDVKAFSHKDCEVMFKIYSAECDGQVSADECERAGLTQSAEIDFMSEKNGSNSTLFYEACASSCGAKQVKNFKEFSGSVCKSMKK